MKTQSSSWAKLFDSRDQKGILSVHISIRACYRGGDPGTGRLLPTAIWHLGEWAWGLQRSMKGHRVLRWKSAFPLVLRSSGE